MKKMVRAVLFAMMAVFSTAVFAEDEDPCAMPANLTEIEGVYQIGTCGDLYKFAEMVNGGETGINGRLTADICVNACGEGESVLKADGSLNGDGSNFKPWTPILGYDGTFDGNGYTISGLYFNNGSADFVGLFRDIGENTKVQNVGVEDSYFRGRSAVGGVVGWNEYGTISNVYNTGVVSGLGEVGGVVGNNDGTVSNVYNTGTVIGNTNVGGVVGFNAGTVSSVYNTGTVIGNTNVGRVVGNNNGTVNKAYFSIEWGLCPGCDDHPIDGTKELLREEFFEENIGRQLDDHVGVWVAGYKTTSNGWLKSVFPSLKGVGTAPTFIEIDPNATEVEISNADELLKFAEFVNAGNTAVNGKLTADIVVNEGVLKADGTLNEADTSKFVKWTPIGTESTPYTGTFDGKDAEGNAHVISGLYFNDGNADYVGLFGYNKGKVQNVGVVDSYIKGQHEAGGVVGESNGTVSNVYNTGTVSGRTYVGGVVGRNWSSVSNVYNTGAVSGENWVGGVVGQNFFGTISNVYNTGAVSGNSTVGGVVGTNMDGTVNMVYNTGAVSGRGEVGGVVGFLSIGTVKNAYYNTDFYAGNALGENQSGSIENVDGITTAELIAIDLGPEWVAGNLAYDKKTGKLTASFPYLEIFADFQYKITALEFKVVDNVIQIANADDLKNFARLVSEFGVTDVDAKLTADIVVNENLLGMDNANVKSDGNFDVDAFKNTHASAKPMAWTPIGTNEKPYTGTFDGNGKSISGLYFNDDTTAFVGVFGILDGAVVKNVGVEDSYFRGLGAVGAVVGLVAEGEVSNVYSKSIVSGKENVGGIVGVNVGKVADSDNMGSVSGKENVGGVAGTSVGKVMDSYNTGTVRGSLVIGGVVGHVRDKGQVDKVYNTGAVSGGKFVGGVIGYNDASFVGNMYNTGSVSGTDLYVGGVVGGVDNKGSVSNVYNMGSVSGPRFTIAGGVVGFDNSAIISNAYFNTDFYTGNALGSGEDVENVGGKTSAELAAGTSLKLDTTAWVVGAVSENVKRDTLYYPYLKVFGPHKYELSDVKKYAITVAVNDKTMGTVTGAGTYEYGTKVEISATAKKGYKFVKWSDGVKDAKRAITVMKAEKLTATFEKDSKKDAVVAQAQLPQFSVTASGKMVSIAGARPNSIVNVFDMQGNRVKTVVATAANFTFALPSAGVYIVKNGYTAKRVNVR
ncbi:MAG: hypothetical protein MJY47_05290 [Fibrobacter sp.]|nr:hypothetical protein [Fibrobacter sp.]